MNLAAKDAFFGKDIYQVAKEMGYRTGLAGKNHTYFKEGDLDFWKLIYDMMGHGQLYHLASDPCELKNLFGQPSAAQEQARLMEELLMWIIRSQDSLPTGPQSRHYQTKWSRKHNWYTPYRHGSAPEAFIA